jgi:hypothetical protein
MLTLQNWPVGETRKLRRIGVGHEIGVTRDQCRGLGGRIGVDDNLDAVDVGSRRFVIGGVALDHDLSVGLEGDELERPGAVRHLRELAEITCDDGRRNNLGVGVGQCGRQVGVGRGELEHDFPVVLRRHLGDGPDIGACGRSCLRIEDRLEARHHVLGGAR